MDPKETDTIKKLRTLMNAASDGYIILDKNLNIIEANQKWLERANIKHNIQGKPLTEIFPNLKETNRYKAYQKVINTGIPATFKNIQALSGTGLIYNIHAFKIDEGLGLIVNNITDSLKAEEKILHLNELLKAIRDVNQLIVIEKNPLRLITESCRILTSTKGFTTAYIALSDGNKILQQHGAGEQELVQEIQNILSTGEIPPEYMEWTTEELKTLTYPTKNNKKSTLLISPLNHHNLNYGIILCQIPGEILDKQVKDLFTEITGDLSYALYALSMEEKINALSTTSIELTKTTNTQDIYKAAFKAMTDAFHFRRCSILTVKDDKITDEHLSGYGRTKKYTLDIDGLGLVARAARTGETVYVPDVRTDPDYIEAVSGVNIRSELCVPVKIDGKVAAILNVERQEIDAFTPQEINLLETLSNYMEAVLSKNKTMESLQKSEENLRRLLHHIPDQIIVVDSESILFVNDTITELLGYQTTELIGKPYTRIFPEKDREQLKTHAEKRLKGEPVETKFELDILSKQSEIITAEVNLNTIDFEGKQVILGIFRDIRERKKMEQHIEYLYQVLLAIRNVNQLIVTEKNRATLLQKACDLMVETKGYNHSRIMTLSDENSIEKIYDTSPKLSKIKINKDIAAYPCIKTLTQNKVTVFNDPASSCDGCPLYFGASGYAILGMTISHNEKTYGYFTAAVPSEMTGEEEVSLFKEVVGDIGYALYGLELEETRNKAVQSLTESEKRYRDLLNSGMDGVTVNILGELVYVNSRFKEMMGYTEDELLGSSILDLHAPEYRELVKERTQQRHEGTTVPNYYEVELIKKDSTRLPVSYSVSRIIYEGKPASLTYIRDLTELKRYERRLAALHSSAIDLWKATSIEEVFTLARETLSNTLSFDRYGITQRIDNYLEATTEIDGKRHRFPISDQSIIARTARTKKTQHIRDTRKDPDYNKGLRATVCLSEITTPVIIDEEVIAVLNVESQQVNTFDEQDVKLLETLARYISLTIEHIKDNTEKDAFTNKLASLHRYAVESLETQSLEQLTDLTIQALQKILEFEFCEVILRKENTLKILKSSRSGDIDEMPLDGPGVVIRAVKTGETQNVPDIRLDPDYVAGGKRDETGKVFKILSELTVPVKIRGLPRLLLNMERSRTDAFSPNDQTLVEILATHTASAYELIQERERRTKYTQKLESLYNITKTLPISKSNDEIAEKIETVVRNIIGFDLGSFGVIKGNMLHHQYIWGIELSEEVILPLNGTGVTVRAVQTGETQFIPDTSKEEDFFTPEETGHTKSELCAPVKAAGKVVAVINIESRTVNAFTQEDNSLLSILAEHVGSTMHNIQLVENEREFTKRLETLSKAVATLNTANTIDELAAETLNIIDKIMEAPYTSFSIIRDNDLTTIKNRGSPLIDLPLPLNGPGITVRAAKEKKTTLVNDTRLDPGFVKGSTDSLSELAIPIIVDGESKGVINMESLELNYFDPTHQSLTETLAANVASNIQRIQNEKETREAERRAIKEQERAEQAIKLEEMKTSFIRTATHEIRTPLTSIKGYTQLAQMKIQDTNNPDLAQYFAVILRNTERLESLSADLLDIERIESGRLELNKSPTHTYDLLDDLKLEMKPILDSRDQKLTITGKDYLLNVDRIRLMQVFVNLVMNASKFSPEDTEIKIKVEQTDKKVSISVIDEGAGIRETDIPKLFKPFPGIRVKGVKDSTGLGLSICKGLVELHDGEIWVESEGLGKGSKFTFTIPIKYDEENE